MQNTIQNKIANHLTHISIHEDDEIYVYLISFAAIMFCMLVHAYLLILTAKFNVDLFMYMNAVNVLLDFMLLYLHKKKEFTAVSLILTAEVTVYATVFILMCGIDTYIVGYYILVAVLQAILPYNTLRLRLIVLMTIVLVSAFSILFSLQSVPQITLSPYLETVLTLSHISILFMGTVIQIFIGNIVKNIITIFDDIKYEEMSALANTDTLTSLYNRRYAEAYFSEIRNTPNRNSLCVAMLDIDDFKSINDTFGHACGDEVLVFLGDFTRENLRKSDLVFRWGGEELLMILSDVDLHVAYFILEKIRKKLELEIIHTTYADLQITVTIGVAELDPNNPEASIKHSDEKLYAGKQGSKNIVVV